MVSEIVTSATVALFALSLAVLYFAEPADDAVAAEVLLGDGREEEGWLPPIFVHFSGTSEPSLQTMEGAILETKRMRVHGVVLFLDIPAALDWFVPLDKVPRGLEEFHENLQHGVRYMLHIEKHGTYAANRLASLFRRWPDMSGRILVVSCSPMFLFALGGNNKNIVKALAWRPCSVAYEDAKCTVRRNEKLVWHLVALAADWLYAWCFEWGLLTRVSMASAVVVDASLVSSRFVRRWSDRGLRVLALASDDPGEQEHLRRVLRVPIVARYSSLPGRE
ncbi:hypothetical protein HPB52_020797 [Rhipicephalus sanguineus]|uniref:Uncharacterized protein n=1 Tax=Rhipicephalus sanguineus TaxID=34632 RepID=A0A9D4SQT7_RHISA|nr:hypothetical protein HPB52_020797 [Rhipicephalus sanguineus]